MKWEYGPHQVSIAEEGLAILRQYGLVYLAMEERTRKSGTALRMVEQSSAKTCLIVTKKKPLGGWQAHLDNLPLTKDYTLINYHNLHKVNQEDFDIIIVDESHAYLSKYPKVGSLWKDLAPLTKNKPLIYLSATPSAQTYALLYHQLKLSAWSPWWNYSSFYKWFEDYGIPRTRFMGGKQFKEYNTVKDSVWESCKHLFISYTRAELGFEHEPNDVLHFVNLAEETKELYRKLEKDSVIVVEGTEVVADTPMSEKVKLHQIEGGTVKYEEESWKLGNTEKIDYILDTWGDNKDTVIMYHYKEELKLLEMHFKKASLLQASSFAEGVELSWAKHLIIYSMNFSTAQYTQRRARQCSMDRGEAIDVHFILAEGAVSQQVYKTVAVNKKNFVDSYYERGLI